MLYVIYMKRLHVVQDQNVLPEHGRRRVHNAQTVIVGALFLGLQKPIHRVSTNARHK